MSFSNKGNIHVDRILAEVDYTKADEASMHPGRKWLSTPELLGAVESSIVYEC